jgi:hypothetical protein
MRFASLNCAQFAGLRASSFGNHVHRQKKGSPTGKKLSDQVGSDLGAAQSRGFQISGSAEGQDQWEKVIILIESILGDSFRSNPYPWRVTSESLLIQLLYKADHSPQTDFPV